jgi:hypothetical protein
VTLTDRFGHFLFSFSSSVRREGKDRVQKQKIHLQVFYSEYLYICVGSFLYFSFVHTLSLSTCVYVHFYIRYWSLGEERSSSFQTQTLTRPWLPSRREGMESISRRTEPNITNDLGLDVCWCNRLFHRHIPPVFLTIITDEVWSKFFQEIYQPNGKTQKKKWNKK